MSWWRSFVYGRATLTRFSGDSKGGSRWAMPPQIFALPPACPPPSLFLNFPFKFVWLTNAVLPNAFCKNTGHFVNSARSELCRNSYAAQGKQTISIVKATINNLPYFGWFVTFRRVCVWRNNRTKDGVNSSQ